MTDWIGGKFPTKAKIDGKWYPLNTHYENAYKTIAAFEDEELTDWERQEILIKNLYYEPYPENTAKAVELGVKFLSCGMDNQSNYNPDGRLYSLKKDGRYIYSAILSMPNGVDLNKVEYMHWWEFYARFMEIGESTFSHIVHLRRQYKKGKLTKEEKEECKKIGMDVIRMDEFSDDEISAIEKYINSD